jgi:hypothetical protein
MLCKEIIAVYCENRTEHTHSLRGRNAPCLTLKQMLDVIPILLYGLENVTIFF